LRSKQFDQTPPTDLDFDTAGSDVDPAEPVPMSRSLLRIWRARPISRFCSTRRVSIFNGIEERPRDRRENLEVWWSEVLKVGGRMRRPFDPRLTAPVMSDVET
jgi:hypothetical protein